MKRLLDKYLARVDDTDDEFDATCTNLRAVLRGEQGRKLWGDDQLGDWIRINKARLIAALDRIAT